MTATALAPAPERPWDRWNLSESKWGVIRKMCASGAPDDVVELLLEKCRSLGADPFERFFYVVPRKTNRKTDNGWVSETTWTLQTSIDLLRSIANSEPNDEYAGQLGPLWTADGKEWTDIWLSPEPPAAAKVGILRKSFKEPLFVTARMAYYVPRDRNGAPEFSGFWSKHKCADQLAKTAEALALRKAFPKRLHGLYISEEMAQERALGAPPPRAAEALASASASVEAQSALPKGRDENPAQALLNSRERGRILREMYAEARARRPDLPEDMGVWVSATVEGFDGKLRAHQAVELETFLRSVIAGQPDVAVEPEAVDAASRPVDEPEAASATKTPKDEPPRGGGEPMSPATNRGLFAALHGIGIGVEGTEAEKKAERIGWCRYFGGALEHLGSFTELSDDQGRWLMAKANEARREEQRAATAADGLHRGSEPCVACNAFPEQPHAAGCPEGVPA